MRRMFPGEGFHRAKTSTMFGDTITADEGNDGDSVFINDEKTFAFGWRVIAVKGSSHDVIIDGVVFPSVIFVRSDNTISSTPADRDGNFFFATTLEY